MLTFCTVRTKISVRMHIFPVRSHFKNLIFFEDNPKISDEFEIRLRSDHGLWSKLPLSVWNLMGELFLPFYRVSQKKMQPNWHVNFLVLLIYLIDRKFYLSMFWLRRGPHLCKYMYEFEILRNTEGSLFLFCPEIVIFVTHLLSLSLYIKLFFSLNKANSYVYM